MSLTDDAVKTRRFTPGRSLRTGLAVCLAGCGGGAGDTPSYAVEDSAGIPIIANERPSWTPAAAWRVDTIPTLDISGAADDALHRVASPRVLADGRIVLFNGNACEVRFYSAAGELQGASGRCGEGPGEFAPEAWIASWRGDSILVVDRLTRVSVLDPGGAWVRTVLLPATPALPLPIPRGVLADGSLVVASLRDPAGRDSPGVETASVTIAVLPDLEAETTPIGTFPGPVFEYTELNGRLGRGALAFSGATRWAAGARHVHIGFPDRYEIRVFDGSGALQRIIRRAFDPVAVEQRDIDWLLERRLGQVEGEENRQAVRQAYRDLRHADVMPAFGVPVWPGGAAGGPAMIVDTAGNLWVFAHYRPGEYANEWSVFAPDGVWLGNVVLPDGLEPTWIGDDAVVGLWTDDVGFAHVRRHRMVKP